MALFFPSSIKTWDAFLILFADESISVAVEDQRGRESWD